MSIYQLNPATHRLYPLTSTWWGWLGLKLRSATFQAYRLNLCLLAQKPKLPRDSSITHRRHRTLWCWNQTLRQSKKLLKGRNRLNIKPQHRPRHKYRNLLLLQPKKLYVGRTSIDLIGVLKRQKRVLKNSKMLLPKSWKKRKSKNRRKFARWSTKS